MSLENPFKNYTEKPVDSGEAHTAQDIQEYFAFADPILGVEWGTEGIPEDYTPEYIAGHPQETQIYIRKDSNGEIIAGAKVKLINDSEKIRLGINKGKFRNGVGALLEYTAVREDSRNFGVLSDLTDKRIAWAQDRGANYIVSEAELTNPVSIYTKLRDGFLLVDIQEPHPGDGVENPYFIEIQNIPAPSDAHDSAPSKEIESEWREVTVTEHSYEELKSLFSEGWMGVDIKGGEENPEKLKVPYTLVMERQV